MAYERVLVDRQGDLATITMARPERRNALSLDHLRAFYRAFREVGDSDAPGIALAGNGPVFSAGLHTQVAMGQGDAYRYAVEVMAMASQAASAQEGIAAFLEKRKIAWPEDGA